MYKMMKEWKQRIAQACEENSEDDKLPFSSSLTIAFQNNLIYTYITLRYFCTRKYIPVVRQSTKMILLHQNHQWFMHVFYLDSFRVMYMLLYFITRLGSVITMGRKKKKKRNSISCIIFAVFLGYISINQPHS